MVFCKPHAVNDEKGARKVVDRDGILYDKQYFKITIPHSSHIISRVFKGARDKYRIHAVHGSYEKEMIVAMADSFEEISQDWNTLCEKIIPAVQSNPDAMRNLGQIVQDFMSKQGSYRKMSINTSHRISREDFDTKLSSLNSTKRLGHLHDYELHRTLGTGSFGRVLLCKKKGNGKFYAMKIIKKEVVIKLKQVEHTIHEKDILACIGCPFIIHMEEYFQDRKSLYFILEYINGGEMFTHIHRNRYFTYEVARFYAAEIVTAFEYLHNLDIVYRDLKPENLLLDARGHVRITDFGFAKIVRDRTWTLCGTPEYLAPEIILSKGYAHAVDWWALGVLIFEMRCGQAPFFDNSQMEMYKKIVEGRVIFPGHFKPEEKEIISMFLTADLTKRLGNMKSGVTDITNHKYFKGINFEALYEMKVPSPYVPRTSGEGDDSNYDTYDEESITWADESHHDPYAETFISF